jgi:hypothetical protein
MYYLVSKEINKYKVVGESNKGFTTYEALQVDHYIYNSDLDTISILITGCLGTQSVTLGTNSDECLMEKIKEAVNNYLINKRIKKLNRI